MSDPVIKMAPRRPTGQETACWPAVTSSSSSSWFSLLFILTEKLKLSLTVTVQQLVLSADAGKRHIRFSGFISSLHQKWNLISIRGGKLEQVLDTDWVMTAATFCSCWPGTRTWGHSEGPDLDFGLKLEAWLSTCLDVNKAWIRR